MKSGRRGCSHLGCVVRFAGLRDRLDCPKLCSGKQNRPDDGLIKGSIPTGGGAREKRWSVGEKSPTADNVA